MRRAAAALLTLALAAAAALAVPGTASAHGLGGLTNLPIPGWMFLVGGGTVLVVSFVGLAVLWPEPQLVPREVDPAVGNVRNNGAHLIDPLPLS